jgi:hypothetical protein
MLIRMQENLILRKPVFSIRNYGFPVWVGIIHENRDTCNDIENQGWGISICHSLIKALFVQAINTLLLQMTVEDLAKKAGIIRLSE